MLSVRSHCAAAVGGQRKRGPQHRAKARYHRKKVRALAWLCAGVLLGLEAAEGCLGCPKRPSTQWYVARVCTVSLENSVRDPMCERSRGVQG